LRARAKAAGQFTFLLDHDGTLLRWDQSYVSDVWWPSKNGEPGQWRRYQVNPFTASVTAIRPERAQAFAGAGCDLYGEVASG
jgi:hypothetical protein